MADTKEAGPKRKEPAKKGLHGWKAALAVFGCGTFAAFGVFGVLVGILSLFVSTVSSGVSSEGSEGAVSTEQRGQPRQELEPGGLEVCGDYMALESMSDIAIEEVVSISHSDPAEESEYDQQSQRLVSGECSFTVKPQVGTTALWYFDFEFEAIVYDPAGGRDQISEEIFQRALEGVSSEFSEMKNQSSPSWADAARSYYGESPEGVSRYLVVAQTGSVVYTMVFSGDPAGLEGGQVSEIDFERQGESLGSRLHNRFFAIVPE